MSRTTPARFLREIDFLSGSATTPGLSVPWSWTLAYCLRCPRFLLCVLRASARWLLNLPQNPGSISRAEPMRAQRKISHSTSSTFKASLQKPPVHKLLRLEAFTPLMVAIDFDIMHNDSHINDGLRDNLPLRRVNDAQRCAIPVSLNRLDHEYHSPT